MLDDRPAHHLDKLLKKLNFFGWNYDSKGTIVFAMPTYQFIRWSVQRIRWKIFMCLQKKSYVDFRISCFGCNCKVK